MTKFSLYILIKKVKDNPKGIIKYFAEKGFLNWLPDRAYLKLLFFAYTGKKLNLRNPQTFNEKLQWLKLYDRRLEMHTYVDKYAVREYIKETIGEQYLVPLYGVYNCLEEIDFNKLPNQFVLKCTHDSGGVIICKDKKELDINKVREKLNTSLKRNFYKITREWPYKDLKPRIICEKFLEDNITDYKFMCFHGEPKIIQVHRNRNNSNYTLDFYDVNWNKTEIRRQTSISNEVLPKPKCLDEMLNIARKLSKNEIHVRIDLYEVNGKVYFGEKTYYTAMGMLPFYKDEHDHLLGKLIKLPLEIEK